MIIQWQKENIVCLFALTLSVSNLYIKSHTFHQMSQPGASENVFNKCIYIIESSYEERNGPLPLLQILLKQQPQQN